MSARKIVVSLLFLLNLTAVLYANRPQWAVETSGRLAAALGPFGDAAGYLLGRYAHLTGLGPRWALFAPLPQWDYQWHLTAERGDGTELPLPHPPWKHEYWIDPLLEHKQSKFELNFLTGPLYRIPVGRYLCRTTDVGGGARPRTITFTLLRWPILPRAVAAESGAVRGAPLPPEIVDVVSCDGATTSTPSAP